MKEIILIKDGEIALKGLNRALFEDRLIKNLRNRIGDLGKFRILKAQSTVAILPQDEVDFDEVSERVSRVFGISRYSRALLTEKNFDRIAEAAPDYLRETLTKAKTFKVTAKRSDKTFPMQSPQICAALGEVLLEAFPHLRVDVNDPEVTVQLEIRDYGACLHAGQLVGAGGMPVGTSGKASLLLSGGIDSPVAGYMMAKRGMQLDAVHFESPPYTGERAKQKVMELAKILGRYAGDIDLHVVPFTHTQEEIKNRCPEELFTIIMRRFMMRVAQKLAQKNESDALITGESLAQVASQTVKAIACTEAVCEMPVFRPLIGMDKSEIIAVSEKIGTFETSILPYEDCCTVFTPKHPRTKPQLFAVENAERALDIDALVEEAVSGTQTERMHPEF